MHPDGPTSRAVVRQALLGAFRWIDGHADIAGLWTDPALLHGMATTLADPFRKQQITKVAGLEARGFVLGALVAVEVQAGFVAIRKPGSRHPGPIAEQVSAPDWRGSRQRLRLQQQAITTGDRVLLVDDWIETGSQARTAADLIHACGGILVGVSVLVDDCADEVRHALGVRALVRASELAP
jgi:adenine phosphoribosyltransferase